MRLGSIRLRLWSAAAVSILIALAIAGIGLRYLFERHTERRVEAELTVDLDQLIGATASAGGALQVGDGVTDPRFAIPLSGYYWQVEDIATGAITRSRSLWDSALDLPSDKGDGRQHSYEITAPDGGLLIVVDRTVADPGGGRFRAVAAETHATVEGSVDDYTRELAPALALLAVVLIVAIFIQITVGLSPLHNLRAALRAVVTRQSRRLSVAAPREVQPLADEINRLLDAQEKALGRARSRAADLAHGLKTPLQVLSGDIRALRAKGEAELADEIEKSAAAIRRHVERELARARVAPGSGKAACRVAETAARIVSVVKRTPGGERLAFLIGVPEALTAPIDEGDLSEILGNLIENAARFAGSTVRIDAFGADGGTLIAVADDGPGIAEADREAALSRGVRLGAETTGSGLGLAIVSDVVEAYGGTLTLADAAPGLKVEVFLPNEPEPR